MEGVAEEFAHLDEGNGKLAAESIRKEIERLKAVYAEYEKDKDNLKKAHSDAERDAEDLKVQTSKLRKSIMEKKQEHVELECTWQYNLSEVKMELDTLTEKHKEVEGQLIEKERKWATIVEEAKSSSERPERNMVFKGALSDGKAKEDGISVNPRILYPVSGGTALITFEKEKSAKNVLDIGEHKVCIDDCFVRVMASAVELPMPSSIAVDMSVCNYTILVSNIPDGSIPDGSIPDGSIPDGSIPDGSIPDCSIPHCKIPHCISQERLLDKLHIFFNKKKNGGGEVDCCLFLPDSGHVVVTFTEDEVAKRLTSKGMVKFTLDGKTYDLKVTPYVKGDIKDIQFRDSTCRKTVQLTGIPDIMEQGALQDVLEMYFAKGSNGGGQLEVVAYVPVGKSAIAIFEEDNE